MNAWWRACLLAWSLSIALGCKGTESNDSGTSVVAEPAEKPGQPKPAPSDFEAQLYADDVSLDTLPLSILIETLGGVSVILIPRGTPLPAELTEHFSTASDDQDAVEIQLAQGEHQLIADNRAIAKLEFAGIPPAPAGVPRIEAKFVVDVRGRLSVSARDLASQSTRPVILISERLEPVRASELRALRSSVSARLALFADDVALDELPLTVGIETLGGETTAVIARGTPLPAQFNEVFSTSVDNQTSVEVHLVQGEQVLAADNRTLAVFQLDGIPPAPRGVPQIELSLSIDAAGVLSAYALDRGTGRRQSITISSAAAELSKAEIANILAH